MRTLVYSMLAAAFLVAQAPQDREPARPSVGDSAPAFRLNDQSGRAVSISPPEPGEDGHWTILAFYPKAATPG